MSKKDGVNNNKINVTDVQSRLRRRLVTLKVARAELEKRLDALELVNQMVEEAS